MGRSPGWLLAGSVGSSTARPGTRGHGEAEGGEDCEAAAHEEREEEDLPPSYAQVVLVQ